MAGAFIAHALPRALLWADMSDAFGVCEWGLTDRAQQIFLFLSEKTREEEDEEEKEEDLLGALRQPARADAKGVTYIRDKALGRACAMKAPANGRPYKW